MKKRRGCFADSLDKEDFGDESSRKEKGCLLLDNSGFAKKARVEYNENSSKYLFDEDVVDALMLLSLQPDTQYTSPSLPIVYFRKRSHKKKNDGYLMSFFEKLTWSTDTEGLLKLNLDLLPFREFSTQLSLPICPLLDFQLAFSTARFSQLLLLQQYGKIVSTWPKIYLEMLFVDNEAGLRFFLLEGCLKQAVTYISVVLSLFCDTNKLGEYVESKIPVCSVRFKLSCVQDLRKQHAFTFYSFSKLKYINWLYLDSVFQKRCLIAKKLPLPDCTLLNIEALKGQSNLHMKYLRWESSQGSRRKKLKDIIPVGPTKSRNESERQAPTCTVKHGMLPFALSYSAAPLFFASLHLKLLMRSTLACVRLHLKLIRHLQPPSWERYHVKLQEWNRITSKGKSIAVCADKVQTPIVEKPAMFAFCLKPRGLKVPNNGSKCRSQKKVHAAGCRHASIGEQVREEMASNHRPGKRSRVQQQDMEFPDWPSQKRHRSGLYPGKGNLHLGVQVSDELRMREASGAAKRAAYIAVLKQEKAQNLRLKADCAINVAASALMIASAIKASYCPTD